MQEDTEALEDIQKEILALHNEYCVIKKHFMPVNKTEGADG